MRARLVLPFTVVGGAAGWLSAGFLQNPFLAVIEPGYRGLAAGVAAASGALVGLALTRWSDARREMSSPSAALREARYPRFDRSKGAMWARLAAAVGMAGAFTGAVVAGAQSRPNPTLGVTLEGDLGIGVVNGLLAGLAFLPVCALVFAAAQRAERARLGSLVAASDHRAVWGILLTALAAMASVAALDWPFVGRAFFEEVEMPGVGVGVIAVAELAIVSVLLADARALGRVRRSGALEAREEGPALDAHAAKRVDLGLGEGLRVELATAGPAAYRSRERATALVVGDVTEARAALHRALLRGGVGLAVVGLAAGAHLFAVFEAHTLYPGETARVWSLARAVANLGLHL